ncbi:MAG: acyltransferase family protein [Deltaproteobacteria bacterium]|nr:acyltransferase family protein [Deltaproteobacteria bacterium]
MNLSLKSYLSKLSQEYLQPDLKKLDEIYDALEIQYEGKNDPWGLNLNTHRKCFEYFWFFYKHYFRVKLHNKNHLENKNYMIIANHSGQVAIDALLTMMAFIYEINPPHLVRGMIERFVPTIPFVGELITGTGHVLGDRKNCLYLLQKKENILVFPEGVKGIAKETSQFYKLQDFTTGFLRLALQTKTSILPIAIVGAEEFYPYVIHFPKIAKLLKLPVLPLTPTLIPLPSPVDIYIGKPLSLETLPSQKSTEKEINNHVLELKNEINDLIQTGLKQKRNYLGHAKNESRK